MSIFPASDEVQKVDMPSLRSRWVRFLRAWDWDIPKYSKGLRRATKHFPAGTEILLTREQHQSAMAAGVAVSIQNPRLAAMEKDDHGGPSQLAGDP